MKWIYRIFVLILLISMYRHTVFSEEFSQEMIKTLEDISRLNARYSVTSIDMYDSKIWNDKNILVLKTIGGLDSLVEPGGDTNNRSVVNGEWRYIGMTPTGNLVNNPDYPDDHAGAAVINTYKWLNNENENTRISNYVSSVEEYNYYKDEIFNFLENEYGHRFDETENKDLWARRAKVIVPATEHGKGVIKFVHLWDSNRDGKPEEWYLTVYLSKMGPVGAAGLPGNLVPTPEPIDFTAMSAYGRSVIKADERGNEKYEVVTAVRRQKICM